MKRTAIVRRTRIKQVSRKQRARLAEYGPRAAQFKRDNPTCNICSTDKTSDVHHVRGRTGEWLMDERFWLPVCRRCHSWIHENPGDARKKGYLK